MPQLRNSNNLATAIGSISTGGGTPTERKDVNFFDYDGTLLYSYTFAEAAALSTLPDLPTHTGLTVQGWNYSIADIRRMAGKRYPVDAGAEYITDDGHTRLYMRIENDLFLLPKLTFTITGQLTLTVDWGDGTAPDTISSSGSLSHTWNISAFPAEVMIDITPQGSGTFAPGNGSSHLFYTSENVYRYMLQKVELGASVTSILANAFAGGSMRTVTIPNGVTSIGNNSFDVCTLLRALVIPQSVTGIGNYALQMCYSLSVVSLSTGLATINYAAVKNCPALCSICLPDYVTGIEDSSFELNYSVQNIIFPDSLTEIKTLLLNGCRALSYVKIPGSVTTIASFAFYNCSNLYYVDLSECEQVPSLSNVNAFSNTPSSQIIWVKNQTMLDAFSAATNWSSYAGRFRIKA